VVVMMMMMMMMMMMVINDDDDDVDSSCLGSQLCVVLPSLQPHSLASVC